MQRVVMATEGEGGMWDRGSQEVPSSWRRHNLLSRWAPKYRLLFLKAEERVGKQENCFYIMWYHLFVLGSLPQGKLTNQLGPSIHTTWHRPTNQDSVFKWSVFYFVISLLKQYNNSDIKTKVMPIVFAVLSGQSQFCLLKWSLGNRTFRHLSE